MKHEIELRFLRDVFQKCRLQALIVDDDFPVKDRLDLGLRSHLGLQPDYERIFTRALGMVRPNTLCKFTDQFLCSYIFIRIPDEDKSILVIGPYLAVEVSRNQMLEQAERNGLPPSQFKRLERYYEDIPVLTGDNHIFTMLDVFCEHIWGSKNAYYVVDFNLEMPDIYIPLPKPHNELSGDEMLDKMREMENRYAFENEFLKMIASGNIYKAERLLKSMSVLSFELRLADPIRNGKNYCIIMNTLLRKAAEAGGVHPYYLDRMSSEFAYKIESVSSAASIEQLMKSMLRSYCRLVNKHSMSEFSPMVQKAVACINAELGADLGLKKLAEMLGINASYLSSIFKKETGHTVTDYINTKRVELAAQLLSTTKLQIQTVAQHCGITDVNYFSKIFKKYMNKTPNEFRKENKAEIIIG